MIQDVTVPARLCTCDLCGYEWISTGLTKIPSHCMNKECRSRKWNGQKERRAPDVKPVIVLPRLVKVRGGNDDE